EVLTPPVRRDHADGLSATGEKRGRLHSADAAEPHVVQVFRSRQELIALDIRNDDPLPAAQRLAAAAARSGIDLLPIGRGLGNESSGRNELQDRFRWDLGLNARAV